MSDSEDYLSPDEYEDTEYSNSNTTLFLEADAKIIRKDYIIYLFPDCQKFLEKIKPWCFNQPTNRDHINNIKLEINNEPCLTGVFTVIQLEDGKIYLLDGHHRQQAMIELYKEDFDVPIEITVHCYKSDTINSSRTSSLFHKLNNTKPFSVGPVVTITVIQIIDYLETHYPGMIRDTSTRANYPNIHKKTLNKCLYEHLNQMESIDFATIIHRLERLNRNYKRRAKELVEKKKRDWSRTKTILERSNLYLGLVTMKTWVSEITR